MHATQNTGISLTSMITLRSGIHYEYSINGLGTSMQWSQYNQCRPIIMVKQHLKVVS